MLTLLRSVYRRIVLPSGLTALLISDPEMADAVAATDGVQDASATGDGSDEGSDEVSRTAGALARSISRHVHCFRPRCCGGGGSGDVSACMPHACNIAVTGR